jgi:asparagine synthase (glutamine-hydrolysing)
MLGLLRNTFGSKLSTWIIQKVLKKEFSFNLNQKLAEDIQKSLVTLIHYSDHVSMGHSIESRMPFMDYRIVEFLASIPASYKMHSGWTKYIARIAFMDKLPESVVWRKDKMGWLIPENYWFRNNLKDWFTNSINTYYSSTIDMNYELESKRKIEELIRYLNIAVMNKLFFKEN